MSSKALESLVTSSNAVDMDRLLKKTITTTHTKTKTKGTSIGVMAGIISPQIEVDWWNLHVRYEPSGVDGAVRLLLVPLDAKISIAANNN